MWSMVFCIAVKTPIAILILILAASGLSEEQVAIQSLASDFAKKEMLPHMAKWDQEVLIYLNLFKLYLDL